MKIRGRVYVEVDPTGVQPNDVVRWVDSFGSHANRVLRVYRGKEVLLSVERHAHEGERPIRVPMSNVTRCWRWHKKMTDAANEDSSEEGGELEALRANLGGEGISWSSLRPAELWATLRSYIGLGSAVRHESIADPDSLARFLEGRASFVAQTSLYGYLHTRAGMRYPELFQDDVFLESINIAKWHVWLDCLSDFAVYAGGRLARDEPRQVPRIARLMATALDQILARAGTPPDGR